MQEFYKNLAARAKPVVIKDEVDPKLYNLSNVFYTMNKKVVLVGKVYEYQDEKKERQVS